MPDASRPEPAIDPYDNGHVVKETDLGGGA